MNHHSNKLSHTVLGIETSCDETAAAIVSCDNYGNRTIKGHALRSQFSEHQPWGGVVPEIAARAHLDILSILIKETLQQGNLTLQDITAVAATCGPGLIGGVMVGSVMGKAIAAGLNVPFVAVNHLEAHALSVRLTYDVEFPFLLLLVSGGHCQLVRVSSATEYYTLGRTHDDAAGECLDKAARLLELGWPGGPAIERAAREGNPLAFSLPRPSIRDHDTDFSFAGLKTAVRNLVESLAAKYENNQLPPGIKADIAASLQMAVFDVLVTRTANVIASEITGAIPLTALVAAGGVAANQVLRGRLADCARTHKIPLIVPPPEHCTDNGLMIAWAGIEKRRLDIQDKLDVPARPRWDLGAR